MVHTDVVELEYDFVPPPSEAVDVIVGFVPAVKAYELEYEPESIVKVREAAVIVKLIELAVAAAYPASAAIVAPIVQVPVPTKATRPDDELTVHTEVFVLEYDFVPLPAEAVDVIVGLVPAFKAYEFEYEPELIVSVRVSAVTVNVLDVAVAAAYPASAAIVAPIVHVPASTNATTPDDEPTVHTEDVELENVFVPEPAEGVADIVGGVALNRYGPESPVNDNVREAAVTVKLTDEAVADEYPPPDVIDAEIVQVPESTNATRPDEELMVHTEVSVLEYDFVPLPSAADAVEAIVGFVAASKAYELE